MNNFIVWDKTLKCFHSDGRVKLENGVLKSIGEDFTIHREIGLKDINKKSIYADCSVIEYTIKGVYEFIKLWGIVTYDENNCCYVIKVKNQDEHIYPIGNMGSITKINIKIIDTIQENKLRLIKS